MEDYSLVNLLKEFKFLYEFLSFQVFTIKKILYNREKLNVENPVVVIPGFLFNDFFSKQLRILLKLYGIKNVYGWNQGLNWGYDEELEMSLIEYIDSLYEEHGKRVILVGWSLGGIVSREFLKMSDSIELSISLGSPVIPVSESVSVKWIYNCAMNEYTRNHLKKSSISDLSDKMYLIYSWWDGVVNPSCCIKKDFDNSLMVSSTHLGYFFNIEVLKNIIKIISENVKGE